MIHEIPDPFPSPPRYASRPFPSYRYVPGLHPHPVAHPQGHSHNAEGLHPAAGPLLPPERWQECDDYLYGADLYNHWYWWEAHEAWEGIWQQSDKRGTQGEFLQGLIQVSAAHLKKHMQQEDGMRRLLGRALAHLKPAVDACGNVDYMGIVLPEFIRHVESYFAGSERAYPFLRLQT